ncbi:S1C family serine protease [Cohnella sp. CFH 77786]|uniref:S1C family serine protease n=1 Tax=Cohnella sp. CFH 77786 TaxID=2662265 RepID=UPI001C60C7BB|nr:trypsin-like peptidase domain-containing protein [Cohnella sp. CFH 77786]
MAAKFPSRKRPPVPKRNHSGRNFGNFFVPLFRKCRRGIVYIQAIKKEEAEAPPYPFPVFFPGQEARTELIGFGTGFVINKDGLILTSEHVVRNAREIKVSLYDGKQCSGELVWSDQDHDIALLKLDSEQNLPPLPLGSSRRSEVGEIVMSVGNPLGLENSLTSGVISRKHKSVAVSDTELQDIIQTDCAINPGSSGGPLINLKGQVIGMNAFMAKNKNGLGFALGIDGIKNRIRRFLD